MFIWGSGSDTVPLGQTSQKHCPVCDKERNFSLFLQYNYSHIYYIFGSTTSKSYLYVCEVCNRGTELNAPDIEKHLGQNPIPFMRRRGGWVFLGLVALLILFGVLSEAKKSKRRADQNEHLPRASNLLC